MLSPAVSGAPVVADFLGGDVSESYWAARRPNVVAAAGRAGSALGLDLTRDAHSDERVLLVYADRTEKDVVRLRIESRTDILTYIRINADAGLARLMSRQILEELKSADAFVVTWEGEGGATSR